MDIALTGKLSQRSKIKPTELLVDGDPLYAWTASIVTVLEGRGKQDLLVLVNHANRFLVGLELRRGQSLSKLAGEIGIAIEDGLLRAGFNSKAVDAYLAEHRIVNFYKNTERRYSSWVGQVSKSLNRLYDRFMDRYGQRLDVAQACLLHNQRVYKLDDGSDYFEPYAEMGAALQQLSGLPAHRYEAYELLIQLDLQEYVAERRVVVDKHTTFEELHHIIQKAMGWQSYHLYEFQVFDKKEQLVAQLIDKDIVELYEETEESVKDYTLADFADNMVGIIYVYDYGDYWEHRITISQKVEWTQGRLPYLLEAKGKTPPEDCGGVWGFVEARTAYYDPDHPDHDMYAGWYDDRDFEMSDYEKSPRELKAF